ECATRVYAIVAFDEQRELLRIRVVIAMYDRHDVLEATKRATHFGIQEGWNHAQMKRDSCSVDAAQHVVQRAKISGDRTDTRRIVIDPKERLGEIPGEQRHAA